jgi:hypothetical protein
MLKAAALERAEAMGRYLSALTLKGYGQVDRNLAEALPALQEALAKVNAAKGKTGQAEANHCLAKALFYAGVVLKEAKEETGLQGFLTLSNEAGTLSLVFSGLAMQGKGRKRAGW